MGTTRVNASEETIRIGPLGIRFLLTGDDSNGSVSVFEVLVPVGQKLAAPAHKNDAYEEILYGIEGVLTWTVDGTPIKVGPGQALCIPRGAVHRFDNFGNQDVKQLAVISPAIMGPAYFRDAAEVINAESAHFYLAKAYLQKREVARGKDELQQTVQFHGGLESEAAEILRQLPK